MIQVAQEAGVPVRIGEVVTEFACLWVEPGQLLAEFPGTVGGGQQAIRPDRVVTPENVACCRERPEAIEHSPKPVSVVVGRVSLEVGSPMIKGNLAAYSRSTQEWVLDQVIVLAEAHEDAAEHPSHGDLSVEALSPLRLAERGAAGGVGRAHIRLRYALLHRGRMAATVRRSSMRATTCFLVS